MPAQTDIPPDLLRHVTAIRHDLHQHPELGYQEERTRRIVADELRRLGIQHKTGFAGGTGIVALIHGTQFPITNSQLPSPPKCVALRADMDALPIHEATNLPYASVIPGKMHACGHDGHMAILLGAAAMLQANTANFKGTVKLIFQPAEEGGCGADKMCEEGVLASAYGPKVDAIFGLHGWPGLKAGMAATRPGPLLASVDGFTITVTGKGGHAAAPKNAIDPLLCAAAIVGALQAFVPRDSDPLESGVLTVSQFHAGSSFNVIPETAELNGTIRALSDTGRKHLLAGLERIARATADTHGCTVTFQYFGTTPCTNNTPELAEFIATVARETLGERAFAWAPQPAMWGEDFAFYLQRVPGCFFVLGVQPQDRNEYPMLHNAKFDFTDAAIPHGIRMMTGAAIKFLAER